MSSSEVAVTVLETWFGPALLLEHVIMPSLQKIYMKICFRGWLTETADRVEHCIKNYESCYSNELQKNDLNKALPYRVGT